MLVRSRTHVLGVNQKGQDYFVGDLHGEDKMLEALLSAVSFDKTKDRLIAVGDLIDRGPGSVRLLDMLGQEPWFYSVMGNHELMMRNSDPDCPDLDWLRDGGRETLEQIKRAGRTPRYYVPTLYGMPRAIQVKLADGRWVGVVHAEVSEEDSWSDVMRAPGGLDLESEVFWGRSRAFAAMTVLYDRDVLQLLPAVEASVCANLWPVSGIDLVIAGHTPMSACEPVAVENMLFIDTGACFDGSDGSEPGRLTLVNPLSGTYWQAMRTKDVTEFQVTRSELPKAVSIADVKPSLSSVFSSMTLRLNSRD